jgi:pimeloyl-ACP methyl ester carboxylesterase
MKLLLFLAVAATGAAGVTASTVSHRIGIWADAGGHRLRLRIEGEGTPAVIFDSFGIAPAEAWHKVQPEVARFTRTVAYDHAGFWGSEPGPKPRDGRQLARELRAALRSARVEPPYVLVGHSFGGPYVRIFAAMYPDDVAGLVLVDPSQEHFFDWLRVSHADVNRIPREEEVRQTEYGCSWRTLNQARAAGLPPDVPVVLITAMGLDEREPQDRLQERRLKRKWLHYHRIWASSHPNVRHRVTTRCGHGVPLEQPQLVVEAIRNVLREGSHPR